MMWRKSSTWSSLVVGGRERVTRGGRRRLGAGGLTLASTAAAACLLAGAPGAAADTCANASLRTGGSAKLPDCRAYELVTPAFKYGELPFSFAAANSEHLGMWSLGAFGEAADDVGAEGAFYDVSRTPTGWQSTSIEPPAAQFNNSSRLNTAVVETSEDFKRALLAEIPISARPIDQRFYIHEADGSLDGSLAEVGPLIPHGAIEEWTPGEFDEPAATYAGASRDLSRVLFYSTKVEGKTNFVWPGDTTVAFASLYEYVGTGHTGTGTDVPALVGVKNNGEPITQCGVYLGMHVGEESGSGNTDNAISEDGSAVFFTARRGGCSQEGKTGTGPAVAEVDARVEHADGSRETVALSEPSHADCEECDLSEQRAAVYQGASRNGQKVFFLSKQTLLPGSEDNEENEARNLYEYNFEAPSGHKLSLISKGVLGVVRSSEDGSRVYYVTEGGHLKLYESPPGITREIATLPEADEADWRLTADGPTEVTPDGRYLVFNSTGDLTPDAGGSGSQLYRYDADTGKLIRVSIGENGFNNKGNSGDSYFMNAPATVGHGSARSAPVSVSDNGEYVFFFGSGALTEGALNDQTINSEGALANNVYEYHDGHVYLLTDGQDRDVIFNASGVNLIGASRSGSDVFFTTGDRLASQDTDTQLDIYDARIDGGVPGPPPARECLGEQCRGSSTSGPEVGGLASNTLSGDGNLPAQPSPPKQTAAQIRAAKLKQALKACRTKRNKKKRKRCEAAAKRSYGQKASTKANKSTRRGK